MSTVTVKAWETGRRAPKPATQRQAAWNSQIQELLSWIGSGWLIVRPSPGTKPLPLSCGA
ncbi:MAG: hypothetical protein IPN52_05205 [Micrococcales bacterium]|nr:hypothetical protein [Micrococcales bacterium]